MRSTGIVRKIDELGRIVLPSELRKILSMRHGDELSISVEGDLVILEKRQDLCIFCSAASPSIEYKGRRVCERCAAEVARSTPTEIRLNEETSEVS
jgi:AbrB family transcriptional regulator, transcriptional pleiotropic regulator of transition state genes